MKKVFLDAGHGGKDSGAVYKDKNMFLKESDLVLKITNELHRLLKVDGRFNLKLSRNTDVFIPINKRSSLANEWKADIFISIHLNSFNKDSKGYETLICGNNKNTIKLANNIHKRLISLYSYSNIKATDRKIKQRCDVGVLKNTKMSAVLTENLFISNYKEALFVKNNIKKIAYHHYLGILDYFGMNISVKEGGNSMKLEELEKRVAKLEALLSANEGSKALEKEWKEGISKNITDGKSPGKLAKREEVVAMILRNNK